MKFKYSVFTENTPEMREWLESIGYYVPKITSKWDLLLTTSTGNAASISNKKKGFLEGDDSFIDCRSNPQLFQAVTAIRDDTDNQQFFIHKNGEFILCWQNELKNVLDNDERYQDYCVYDCHKATLEELITHFKTK